jgi:hypothetical protein
LKGAHVKIIQVPTRRRLLTATAIAFSALAFGACGGTDDDTTGTASSGGSTESSSNDRDSARVRLIQCLREQGLDIPDDIGESGAPPPNVDADALEAALAGPCAKYRGDAFGDVADPGVADAQEKMDKYAQCMRDAGFDFPDVELGNGPPTALHELDQSDPDFQAADKECADLRVTPADVMGGP